MKSSRSLTKPLFLSPLALTQRNMREAAGPPVSSATPMLRKPSATHVKSYLARHTEPLLSLSATPGKKGRIFYELDDTCPPHYYPLLHEVDRSAMLLLRRLLLVLCVTQAVFAVYITYTTRVFGIQHDALNEIFMYVFAALCMLAAVCGFIGTCLNSRAMLLFFYINQLWGLSNAATYFMMSMRSLEQSNTACRLAASGELTEQQLKSKAIAVQ